MNTIHYKEQPSGFEFGAAKVTRVAAIRGNVFIEVSDINRKHLPFQIHVSPTGKSIRIYRKGKELK